MTDYDVYIRYLDKPVEVVTKDKLHVYGVVTVVGETSLLLEKVLANGDGDLDKTYPNKSGSLADLVNDIGWDSRVENFKNISELKPLYTESEKEKLKKHHMPQKDVEEETVS